jgi:hypothetical protein
LSAAVVSACGGNSGAGSGPADDPAVGQTDFTSIEQASVRGLGPTGQTAGTMTGAGGSAGAAAPAVDKSAAAPAGRVADVQEADIYKLVGTRLFYFNTYRGFIVYDVSDATKPVMVSRLPVYGYPVEMFVDGNTVYALLRDALYLSEVNGKLQFQRHDVSQLVTIDVSDVANPRILKTLDIIGQLHEGVSRKIDNTIYVVSEQFNGYYWGWQTPDQTAQSQAWVYSYDVSDPTNPKQAGQLPIFQGGEGVTTDSTGALVSQRWFGGVSISATANALMVVENWSTYSYVDTSTKGDGTAGGGSSSSGGAGCATNQQQSVVSVIDVSDPTGVIRLHTHFQTDGALDDQFKMTYRYDDATGKGTFFGIFNEQSWDCAAGSVTSNQLESWDITDGTNPKRVAALEFGKGGETVRGTAYDLTRNVVYAITARQIDPLYAIDIADPNAPRIVSQIDGLSGSISVFRSVGGGSFLLGVGQDTSTTCTGQQTGDPTWLDTKMSVSIIDVRDLTKIRLAQRGCVAIQGGGWSWSSVNWNLDQAHKMLGMFQDGDLNILTVPISYYTQETVDVGWWYRWQTAVGILTWDLSRYDDTKPPEQQTVVQSYGTFVHPQGEVTRSILFKHPTTGERTMINISDTHLSVAGIADLAHPKLEAVVEVAPSVDEIYGFGDYVVERVDQGGYWSSTGLAEFRVKHSGGPVDDKTPVATFQVGQAAAVYRYKQSLVILRNLFDPTGQTPATTEAVVYDLADPINPRLASRTTVPFTSYGYYGFYCGDFWGGYWFGRGQQGLVTDAGLVQLTSQYTYDSTNAQSTWTPTLAFLDLRNLDAPTVGQLALPSTADYWSWDSLVADPAKPSGFYLARRDYLGDLTMNGTTFSRYRYYAQRIEAGAAGTLVAGTSINLPGPLGQTWLDASGTRRFLTNDTTYRTIQYPDHSEWHGDTRLNLLRQVGDLAALTDSHTFADTNLSSFVLDHDRLFVSAQNLYYWWAYPALQAANPPTWESTTDRLEIFDVSAGKLTSLYDQPTRTYGVQLMGMYQGRLFVSLPGDGVLAADVSDPTQPSGLRFLRTLGWASHLEFAGNDGYVAAGSFGVFDLDLTQPADVPVD